MAQDIKFQRERVGGNFVIARAIESKEARDQIRNILTDCIFIILTITKEKQEERILARHGDGEAGKGVVKCLTGFHEWFGLPEKDEENTYNINITDNMTPEDVMRSVLDLLEN